MNKGDFDEIQEKADEKNQEHNDRQNNTVAVLVGDTSKKIPHNGVAPETAENKTKGGCAAQNNEDHAGQP